MVNFHIEFENGFKFLIDAAIYQKLGSIGNLENTNFSYFWVSLVKWALQIRQKMSPRKPKKIICDSKFGFKRLKAINKEFLYRQFYLLFWLFRREYIFILISVT